MAIPGSTSCYRNIVEYHDKDYLVCRTCKSTWKDHSTTSCNNELYIDTTFPPENSSLFFAPTWQLPFKWIQIEELPINKLEKYFSLKYHLETASPYDVEQGTLGNCWLIAGIIAVAQKKLVLRKLFDPVQNYPNGIYQINLHVSGSWMTVLIDDVVPLNSDLSALGVQGKKIWPALIEKAAAKVYRCYGALETGTLAEALNLLTGAPCEYINFWTTDIYTPFDMDATWNRLSIANTNNYVMTAGSGGTVKVNAIEEIETIGLMSNHVYAVIKVMNLLGKRLVKLMNPHNTEEYKGNWSYSSLEAYPGYQKILYPTGNVKKEFWMSFFDFVKYFEVVCVAKTRSDWIVTSVTGHLSPLLMDMTHGFRFLITQSMNFDIVFHQMSQKWFPPPLQRLLDVCLILYMKNEKGDYIYIKHIDGCCGLPLLNLNSNLLPGDYLIVPISFDNFFRKTMAIAYPKYVLKFYSLEPINVNPHMFPVSFIRETITLITKKYGATVDSELATVYYYSDLFFRMLIVAENKNDSEWLRLTSLYVGNNWEYKSTRDSLSMLDYIPPGHTQVLAVLTSANEIIRSVNACYHFGFDFLSAESVEKLQKHLPDLENSDNLHTPFVLTNNYDNNL